MEITEETIEQHKETFKSFLKSTEMKACPMQYVPSNCVTNFFVGKTSQLLGYGDVSLDEIKFLKRFFADESKIKQAVENLTTQETIQYLNDIFAQLKQESSMADLKDILAKSTQEQIKEPEKVQDVDEQGNYIIPDDL